MSFFDDQMDDWFANDCKGSPDDYYCGEIGPWVDDKRAKAIADGTINEAPKKPRTEAQKARKRRNRARRRAKQAAQGKEAKQ